MKIYKINKPVTKIYELEIKSNITLPYGVVMELKNYIRGLVPNGFYSNLTKETITILKNYENEMSDIDITNLEVKGAFIQSYENDENDNDVEITGEFL
jgi:hypothetical protein